MSIAAFCQVTRVVHQMKEIVNSEKEGRYLIDDKDLPIVLVHGTMGKSEDWSRVVEGLSNSAR
jgi:hypothetical protein